MEEKRKQFTERYDDLMNGFERQQFISNEWPLENGVYKQYSVFDSSETSISGTGF
jgi:hypothetical protein